MGTLYVALKHSHLLLVAISLTFFIVRGVALIAHAQWLGKKWAKISPHVIDTFLLLSGIGLMFIIQQYPIEHSWLTSKMIFLVGYIGFGIKMMRSTSAMQQRSYFAAAIVCIVMMISIARTHEPFGLFSVL
ncbi:SirB2 family protein [Bermanella sp. R86510]|uniref:SirB2 family protein n=1 Tax=unclassified Bermanella TaxID=2627862 RepID=UPI0037C5084B